MKVCFISASFVREREILKELNNRLDLLFVCPYRHNGNYSLNDLSSFCNKNTIRLLINDFTIRRARSLFSIKKDFAVVKEILSFKPDVLYIEAWGSPYFALLCRLMFGKKNTVIAIMDYKLHQRRNSKFRFSERFYLRFQTKFYSRFQLFSYSQEKLFALDHPKKNRHVIRLFLVEADLPKVPQTERIDNKSRFLFFGRIFYYKGVDILLEAVNILSASRDDFIVTIAGQAENWDKDFKPIIKYDKNLELIIKYVSKEELSVLFCKAEFFVAPYREVTQSGPLIRAYNFDLIPLTSDEEGFLEYVESGKNGLVFQSGSAKDLAEKMELAIDLSAKQRELITHNIEKLKLSEFNINNVVNKYIQMFKEASSQSLYGKH